VVSWFTSFGYFDDTDNRRVLHEAHRVLRPAGSLLTENNNLVELLPRWQPAFVTERDATSQSTVHASTPFEYPERRSTGGLKVKVGSVSRFSIGTM
jgi:hypothetical protein